MLILIILIILSLCCYQKITLRIRGFSTFWHPALLMRSPQTSIVQEAAGNATARTSMRTPIVGMLEPKMDDRAYYYNRFYRHVAFKSKSSCLRFAQNIGYFRRHDDVFKHLSCLQLKFSSFLAAGMMADFQLNVPTLENARWRQLDKAPVFLFLLCYNNMTFKRACGENVTPSSVLSTSVFMTLVTVQVVGGDPEGRQRRPYVETV